MTYRDREPVEDRPGRAGSGKAMMFRPGYLGARA